MSFLLILLAPLIGILVGLIPGLGASIMLLLLYPFLLKFEPIIIILFYAVMVNAKDFSGSVSAIGFGMCGELTSIPAVKESKIIMENNQQYSALKNTMIGSVFGTIIGSILLYVSIIYSINYPFFMRSDVLATFILITSLILIFWTTNKYYINLCLIFVGLLIGSIGFDKMTNQDFLTFNNSYLSGGIPLLPFLFGIYVIPKMIEIYMNTKVIKNKNFIKSKKNNLLNLRTLCRGSLIGSVCGLIPYIGTIISSNVAHFIENKFYKKNNDVNHSLIRLNAAETANNAGQITMLIPLLILGIAVSPSELVLLDLIQSKGWLPSINVTKEFLFFLLISIIFGTVTAGFFCYNVVIKLLFLFYRHYKKIMIFLLAILIIDIFYLGYTADQIEYYIFILVISSAVGLFFKKIDFAPLIIMFLLQDSFSNLARILPLLYGF
jgi:putative tricarboxylic transport membrane protein